MNIKTEKRNYTLIKKLAAIIVISLSAALFGACKGALVDPPLASFEIIEGPADESVLNVDQVYFKWRGSSVKFDYRFKLMIVDKITLNEVDYIEFTEWNKETEKLFKNLDEGEYVFRVQASYEGADPIVKERKFEIDAVQGASIMIYKRETTAVLGSQVELSIWAEDIDSLTALDFTIAFDKSLVQIDSVDEGDLSKINEMEQFIGPYVSLIKDQLNQAGSVSFTTGFFKNSAESSISGDGKIMRLFFSITAAGKSEIELRSAVGRGISGNYITVNRKGGIINGVE